MVRGALVLLHLQLRDGPSHIDSLPILAFRPAVRRPGRI